MDNKAVFNILLVDDDELNNFLCSRQIKKYKDDVILIIFENAKEALIYLKTTKILPDIILLDINMPKMDGWKFLDKLKKSDIVIPTVFVVTYSERISDKKKAASYKEIKSYISKPLSEEKLEIIFG